MKITEITENINFYDRFGHDTGARALPYTVEVRDRETGGKKLISIQAVSAADARERARDRGYRVVRVVSQDDSQHRKNMREHDGRDDEPEETDDDGRTMADRARRDGRGSDDEPETAAQRRKRSLQATRDFNRGRRADGMGEGVAEGIMKSLATRLVKGAANRQTPQEIANTHVRALNQRAPGTRMQGHPNFADFKREVHSYISAAQDGEQAFARTTDDHVKSLFKKYFSEGVAEGKSHISPSGVKTNMDPKDDDYEINYGKNGLVAKFRKDQGMDVKTGGKKVDEGIMDTIKGAAKEFTRDSLQKKIKQAWENTFWPRHIEPALNRIQINGQPFRRMVLGEPRVIENDRSRNAVLKQYTVNIVFPIDPEQWSGDEIRYLEGQLRDIEDGDWNPKVHGLGLVSFDQPMKSFQYTKGRVPDLVIPVRITSLDINRSLVGEQGVAEGAKWRSNPDAHDINDDGDIYPKTRDMFAYDPLTRRQSTAGDARTARGKKSALKTSLKMAQGRHGPKSQLPEEQGVAEGGPFSYGAKKPRKGSVADLADKKRREQEQGKQPVEPRDQQVGVAKVTKGVAEGDVIQGPWSGMNRPEPGERYAIVRTRPDGTRDFAAGHFDSWQKAKQELQKFLKHELHTELGHQFEIVKKKGVAEGHADQQRTIVKRNGQPVGEIGIDRESSPGVGQYYMKHYASGTDNSGYGSREEALGELKHYLKQGVRKGKKS